MSADPPSRAEARLREAKAAWGRAMAGHTMAPPDAGFAARLRDLATAAELEREACDEAAREGLAWRPIPGAEQAQPPYELRPGTGRRGPVELWSQFDAAVQTLNDAITRPDVAQVARGFAELASAARALADAVAREDRGGATGTVRRRAV